MQYSNAFQSSGRAAKWRTFLSAQTYKTILTTVLMLGFTLGVPQSASANVVNNSASKLAPGETVIYDSRWASSRSKSALAPGETVIYDSRWSSAKAKRSNSALRPGETVIYDSRWSKPKRSKPKATSSRSRGVVIWDSAWSDAQKRRARSNKGRVRVASLGGSTSIPKTLTPRRSRPSYGGKISGAYSSCFPSSLRRILRNVASRFGSVHINSGYRSPRHNRAVGGARNSQHKYCRAADIKVWGVSKYTLARFLRRQPGRGSVGTYGCKSHVHVDVGPYRNWHKGCGRRRYKRRYARR